MGVLKCIKCSRQIAADDVNIETDLAKCGACGAVFRASDALDAIDSTGIDLSSPPNGVRLEGSPMGFKITATTRSSQALFLIPFTLVWVGFSMTGLYIIPIVSGAVFSITYIFGLPFLIASVILTANTLMAIMGKIEISAHGYDGRIFTGIGPFGHTRRFSWHDVQKVAPSSRKRRWGKSDEDVIALEGKELITFGSALSDERRYFISMAIRNLLRNLKR